MLVCLIVRKPEYIVTHGQTGKKWNFRRRLLTVLSFKDSVLWPNTGLNSMSKQFDCSVYLQARVEVKVLSLSHGPFMM